MLEVPLPEPAAGDIAQNGYTFERPVTFQHADGSTSPGFIDLYRRGVFVLETKQGVTRADHAVAPLSEAEKQVRTKQKKGHGVRGTAAWDTALQKARAQAERYARALPAEEGRPPFVVVVDVGHCIELYAEFSRSGGTYVPFPDPRTHRIQLDDLAKDEIRALLRTLWLDPMALDPSRRAAKVTREIADTLAKLAKSLEASGHTPKGVAEFLMRCLFTMFAEDVKLLPPNAFQLLLADVRTKPDLFQPAMEDLWRLMNTGGFSARFMENILRFNGGLFATPSALPLNKDQIQFLTEAAEKDWRDVEPAIFGTLLERALDPRERHKLGAHYTPRAYVERLVLPTVIEPLREAWQAVQTAAYALAAQGKEKEAHKEIHAFHRRLCQVRVLDPACGSGNFLYVALEHLKRLEGEVFNTLHDLGESQTLIEAEGLTVDPHQFLGIEINPRAAVIAELVLWIGYLQWHYRTHGDLSPPEPVIKNFKNIENRDAILAYDAQELVLDEKTQKPLTRWDGQTTKTHPITGEQVPDDTARIPVYKYTNPRPAAWPEADYVVGNPPFIGTARMRDALGDGYTECIRATIKDVPDSSDYVMYWWNHAAHLARKGKIERFGFITTNSLRQTFNRRVLEHHMGAEDPVSLVFAIPDHPWVDSGDGAAVRIAMTVAVAGNGLGQLKISSKETETGEDQIQITLSSQNGKIASNLSVGAAVSMALPLQANATLSGRGVQVIGAGFIVTEEQANGLGLGKVSGIENVIKPYVNGRDLTQESREVLALDLFGLSAEEVLDRFPEIYQWVLERVKPERDQNNRATYRNNWWIFGEPRANFRPALKGLSRYIATVETSKHRFFVFLDAAILPDNMLVNVALDDAYALGVLSSRLHVTWALATGGRLGVGNDPRYNKTRCFETFPFPDASEPQKARIRALGERLDAHRKARQAAHPGLTMTGMYNVLEKLRAIEKASQSASESAAFRAAAILAASVGREGGQGERRQDDGGTGDAHAAASAAAILAASGGKEGGEEERRQDDGGTNCGGTNCGGTDDGGTFAPQALDFRGAIEIHQGRCLPHWRQEGVAYFVTFRLADSIAQEEGEAWLAERNALLERARAAPAQERVVLEKRAQALMSEKYEALLDAGVGACVLREPQVAQVVAESLRHFDGSRYRLWAWCVMPNHVHAVVEPLAEHALADIVAAWKSFSANKINRLLGRTGALWRKEYFDHIIRNQASFDEKIQYTLDNPKKAGLNDWPWLGHREVPTAASSAAAILAASGEQVRCQEERRQDDGGTDDGHAAPSAAAILAASGGGERRQDDGGTGDGGTLTAKEREIHEQGLVSVLKEIHDALDAAVFEAYGWLPGLSDEEILARLVALNAERAAEEKRGVIRYLRPDFQDPKRGTQTQMAEAEDEESPAVTAKSVKTAKAAWPKDLPGQAQAVRNALRQGGGAATAAEVASGFKGAKVPRVQELLEALAALGQCQALSGDRFVAN